MRDTRPANLRPRPLPLTALPFLVFGLSVSASAEPFYARLYEPGSGQKKLLYTLEVRETPEGENLHKIAVFRTPDGKPAVTEDTLLLGPERRVGRYEMKNLLTHESGTAEQQGREVRFTYTRDNETKSDHEDYPENLIVGPNTVEFLKRHFKELLAGDTVSARYGALDRRETVGFKFFVDGRTDFNGRKAVVVKMKPTSFVIAAIVKPLFFTMDAESGRLLELVGRTLPKIQDSKGRWQDLDADIVYEYSK